MAHHETHAAHAHAHAGGCGHRAIRHDDHTDYLHDGHLHHVHDDHVDECRLPARGANAATCTPSHACDEHERGHAHRPGCGHEAIPHADHADYLVGGHLHHPHQGHCDDHGPVTAL